MPHFLRTNFQGDPNLGLYGFATDKYCLIGVESKRLREKLKEVLKVPVSSAFAMETELLGIFCAGNSHGIVVPKILDDDEISSMEKAAKNILVLKSRYTAFGNLILMNDKGILLSPLMKKEKKGIEKFFGLRCEIAKIAGLNVIGNLGIATNRGCLLNPRAKKNEIKLAEDVLNVKTDIGTVNFGSPYPGAGIITNSNGYVVSEVSSGPELGRITETLGFLE